MPKDTHSKFLTITEFTKMVGNASMEMSDGQFVYNFNLHQYDVEFPYMQRYKCRLELDRPDICHVPGKSLLLLLATKSHPKALARRTAVRQTWAKDGELSGFMVKHIFLMAQSPDPVTMQQVVEEAAEFKDILLWDFAECHHNLSLKERCFIEWLHHKCKEAEFIFKGDDDEFVNPRAMVNYLKETANGSIAVHGFIHSGSDSERDGKYKISNAAYPSDKYPLFPSGGGYIIPGAYIAALYRASTWMPLFPLDDVYFGFLGLAARVSYQHDCRFRVVGMGYQRCAYKEALVVHGIEPEEMVYIWSDVQQEDPCGPSTSWISALTLLLLVPVILFINLLEA
ncbi:N-acetyllactosaminide beta-1,3-N-acetylglucosaminyltransferase 2-like [Ambystoma mexicanum]|uniref:N-acetyllactosaminide beta-1,3-N-acetylglucosaminyltransferase 2-like n=1 Tax=Ambystoma mexicanum TaxID=8296 RepID=UPI0037E84081